jgi:FKBP-type peptidyl-prolyl cis-trans isomerase 2
MEKGDSVVIKGNARDTTWSKGVIVDINAEGALIDYNYPYGVYGQGNRKALDELEMLN